jgi:hypothetical protein
LRVHRSPERDAYIAQNAETLDPEMALAFTELPAAVSGISMAISVSAIRSQSSAR